MGGGGENSGWRENAPRRKALGKDVAAQGMSPAGSYLDSSIPMTGTIGARAAGARALGYAGVPEVDPGDAPAAEATHQQPGRTAAETRHVQSGNAQETTPRERGLTVITPKGWEPGDRRSGRV